MEVFDNGHVPGDPKDRLSELALPPFATPCFSGPDHSAGTQGQLKGPWFQTQLSICLFVFFFSFIYFCIFRTRYKTLYAPRTLLRGERVRRCSFNMLVTADGPMIASQAFHHTRFTTGYHSLDGSYRL